MAALAGCKLSSLLGAIWADRPACGNKTQKVEAFTMTKQAEQQVEHFCSRRSKVHYRAFTGSVSVSSSLSSKSFESLLPSLLLLL